MNLSHDAQAEKARLGSGAPRTLSSGRGAPDPEDPRTGLPKGVGHPGGVPEPRSGLWKSVTQTSWTTRGPPSRAFRVSAKRQPTARQTWLRPPARGQALTTSPAFRSLRHKAGARCSEPAAVQTHCSRPLRRPGADAGTAPPTDVPSCSPPPGLTSVSVSGFPVWGGPSHRSTESSPRRGLRCPRPNAPRCRLRASGRRSRLGLC
ncbi:unnamed protein product [Rangifer tarandus platyrhynchus]|uniref:Uncharacterized protein n=1 Tax=Rangifer tarandus platyrhynchus TaxID=3082113 RepID=A0ABN8Y9J6_RANTA|nr:unnamed protein product [Rangifer tarandus platyrhynchus]